MPVNLIFDPNKAKRAMRVAAFMSGSGTNILRLIEHEIYLREVEGSSPFQVVFIFSDRSDGISAGEKIALQFGLPYISYDIRKFHALRSLKRDVKTPEGLEARKQYDEVARKLVSAFEIDVIALGGYMSYITLDKCVNVHPADLSLKNPDGSRKYVGDHAVRDAIAAGEKELRASTLWTDEGVDTGPLLMVSKPLPVKLPEPLERLKRNKSKFLQVVDTHQEQLKQIGDWKIFPKTVELIARGRFGLDEMGRVYLDGKHIPEGYREDF